MLLSGSFLGISSLVFPETQHSVRDPCDVRDRTGFFAGKNVFAPKMRKMDQKSFFFYLWENLDI